MSAELDLVDYFRASERLFAGLGAEGVAEADQARSRIRARLQALAGAPDVQEYQCPLKNDWEVLVFHALLKRYGLRPYRYRRQRKTTILVRVSKQFMNELLWPIFTDVCRELCLRFDRLADGLVRDIAAPPYSVTILEHEHEHGQLCENCRKRLLEHLSGTAPPS